MQAWIAWFEAHPAVTLGLAVGSVVMLVLCMLALPVVLVHLPEDALLPPHERQRPPTHPIRRTLGVLGRNLLGWGLVVVSLPMMILPGQGVLTLLLGLLLVDLPGKRRLEAKVLGRPGVKRALDALRARYGRPPLRLPGA